MFGDAWPLIQEWRELRHTHPDKGKGLEWLRQEERLMSVELALLDEHGLTLPPQTYPLKGLDRGDQTRWRRTALEDARPRPTAAGTAPLAAADADRRTLFQVAARKVRFPC